MNININSSVEHLFNEGLISEKCKEVLLTLEVNSVFDVMTTKFPEEGTLIKRSTPVFAGNSISYTRKTKKEIDKLINNLYTDEYLK